MLGMKTTEHVRAVHTEFRENRLNGLNI